MKKLLSAVLCLVFFLLGFVSKSAVEQIGVEGESKARTIEVERLLASLVSYSKENKALPDTLAEAESFTWGVDRAAVYQRQTSSRWVADYRKLDCTPGQVTFVMVIHPKARNRRPSSVTIGKLGSDGTLSLDRLK
jgi:hypothetical protein